MRVKIRYFGSARDDAGMNLEEFDLASGIRLSDFKRVLYDKHPALRARSGSLLFAVNQSYSDNTRILSENDEIAVFPVVSGG